MRKDIRQTVQKVFFILMLYSITAFVIASFFLIEKRVVGSQFDVVRLAILILFFPILCKYAVHICVAPWYEMVQKFTFRKKARYIPKVSVIIPAFNEQVGIVHTIQSVVRSKYKNLEVVVVNDGSTDATDSTITTFLKQYNKNSRLKRVPVMYKKVRNGGKAKALNTGVSMAKGDIIVTIDADSVMDASAIKNFVRHFQNPKVMSVAGNVKIGNTSKTLGMIQQLEYLYGFYFKKADSLLNSVYIVGGAAAAYRRSIFDELGNFDEHIITEDIEFSMRIQNAGYTITYEPNAVVYTEGPSDITGLCQQRLRWKHGRLLAFYKYRYLFFSLRKHHSIFLTFVILPIHLFAEALLFLEIALLAIFYGYTLYTRDFFPLLFVMALLTFVLSLQIITDVKVRKVRSLILLAPVAWIIFYLIDAIEYQALVRSLVLLMKKEKLRWQVWQRTGVS